MRRDLLAGLLEARAEKRACALVTDLKNGEQLLVFKDKKSGNLSLGEAALKAVREAIATDRAGPAEIGARRLFIHVFNPPLRMAIVGAVHVAQPLSRMAALAGFEVIVIDPRRAFATGARFPDIALVHEWPDDALRAIAPDHRTAVITLTHDPKLDDPALTVALGSPAFYIGALGSTRTHARRLARLGEAGFGEAELGRIHGPVGLPLGGRSPGEMAVSILAEVVQVRRQGGGVRRAAA